MNQLKVGVSLSYVSIIATNIIALIYTPYMLRKLGQIEFGLYSLAYSVIAYLTVLDLGFGNAIVRYTAKYRALKKKTEQYDLFGMFFVIYSLIGLVTCLVGLVLYWNVDDLFNLTMSQEETSQIGIMILLMAFNLALTFPLSIFGSIITAYEDFVFQKVLNLCRIILNPLVIVVFLYFGYKAVAMIVITTAFNLLTLGINTWYCFHKLKIKLYFRHFERKLLREISIYSFWIFLSLIIDRLYWSTGQFILGVFQGATVVAIYALAIQFQGIYMTFSSAVTSVFLPKVTGMVTQQSDKGGISDLFIRVGRIQYAVLVFVLSGFILFGEKFIFYWAGEDYISSYPIALLFLIPLTFPLCQNLGITILQAENRMKFRSLSYLVISFLCIVVSIPLSKYYGAMGCAISVAIALLLGQGIVINIYYYKKIGIDIPAFWKNIFQMSIVPFVLCTIGLFVLYFFPITTILELVIGIVIYSIVYIPSFFFLSLNKNERNLIPLFR